VTRRITRLPPGAAPVDGRVIDITTGEPYLNRRDLAGALGTSMGAIDRAAARNPADSPMPHPRHVPDQCALLDGHPLIRASVAADWRRRRAEAAAAWRRSRMDQVHAARRRQAAGRRAGTPPTERSPDDPEDG
jgi:hypothetical protein